MNTFKLELAIANEEKLLEAMKSNDIEMLDRLLHDELLFNTPDGQTVTKAMDLDNYRSGHVNYSHFVFKPKLAQTWDCEVYYI